MDIRKYYPINTQEKVDALLSEVSSTHDFNELESIILLEIRKVNVQFYLKEKINQLRQSGKIRLIAKKALKPIEAKKAAGVNAITKPNAPKNPKKQQSASKQHNSFPLQKAATKPKDALRERNQTEILSRFKKRLVGKSITRIAIYFEESTQIILQWVAKYKIKATPDTLISEHIFSLVSKELSNMIVVFKKKNTQARKMQERGLFSSPKETSSRFDDGRKCNYHQFYRG